MVGCSDGGGGAKIVGQGICVNGFHFLRNKLLSPTGGVNPQTKSQAVCMIGWDFESLVKRCRSKAAGMRDAGMQECSNVVAQPRW